MTKTNTPITLPATPIAITAQGHSAEVNPADFHPDAIEAIFTYGLRRWFQDNINSAAAVARNAEAPFDAAASFTDRLGQATTGTISTRGAGTDPAIATNRRAVRELAKSHTALAAAIKATEAGPDRDALLDAIAANNPEPVAEMVARMEAEAKAKTEAAAAMSITV